jgi:hypothetical protein
MISRKCPEGIGEVDPAAVVAVELTGAILHRVGPVGRATRLHQAEDLVESRFRDQEGVMLAG